MCNQFASPIRYVDKKRSFGVPDFNVIAASLFFFFNSIITKMCIERYNVSKEKKILNDANNFGYTRRGKKNNNKKHGSPRPHGFKKK